MRDDNPGWRFYAQILTKALDHLEEGLTTPQDSDDLQYIHAEMPLAISEARESLSILKRYLVAQEDIPIARKRYS